MSGLPQPARTGVPVPAAARPTGNLEILDWAGFTAATTFTFDDAQPSHIDHWPELKAEGVRMTFYVSAGQNWYTGGPMPFDATWRDVVASGSELGDHTYHHCHATLTGCPGAPPPVPFATAAAEIDENTAYFERNAGVSRVWTTAYPFGDRGYTSLAKERFFLARGVPTGGPPSSEMIAPNGATDPFNLPTVAAVGGEAAGAFGPVIDTARGAGKWVIFLFHSLLPDANNWYAGVDVTTVTGAIEYAKSMPDMWIDSLVHVGAYWVGQETLTIVKPMASGAGQTWAWTNPAHFPTGQYLRVTVDGGSLAQGGKTLPWNDHGYYEVSLDAQSLTWAP